MARAHVAKRSYRRFGIESSYRQLNEWKGQTTQKDVVYRLLLLGLALLLRRVQDAVKKGYKEEQSIDLRLLLEYQVGRAAA